MAGWEAIPVHGGQAGGVSASRDVEELRRNFREVILPEFEPVLRRMMREEMLNVLLGCTSTLRIPGNQDQPSVSSHFQLNFNDELPETIFTNNIVEPKRDVPLQIFITDADKRIITSGPLSMIRIEILVLDGHFGDEEQGNWMEEEFNNHVLCEKKVRRPLLEGKRVIKLEGGVGNLGNISFKDNSKWTRTHKFRLGARALKDDHVEGRIKEAISNAFYVNEQRGEYTKKHHIPSPKDEIWRLKKIKKDGPYHKRLVEHGISTVEDFLKSLNMDERKLSSILFGKRMANRDWKTIVQHASKCDLGHRHSSYINPGQQDMVNRLQHVVYDNQNAMVGLNDPTNSSPGLPSALLATCIPGTSTTNHHTTCHEDALSAPSRNFADLIHVEQQHQSCFAMEGCNMDRVPDWNTGVRGAESCSSVLMVEQTSCNNPIHISRSKWVKLRLTVKLWTIKKSISARRSARIQQIRLCGLLDGEHTWPSGYSPPPFIYPVWPEEEDRYL